MPHFDKPMRNRTLPALKPVALACLYWVGQAVYAQPSAGVVTAGQATISRAPGLTTVTQTTPNAALQWQSFNIPKGEVVQFVQPSRSSVALNRVLGAEPSYIAGQLTANGQVFLINPLGIVFAPSSSVNVGGLVASTLGISDAQFMRQDYRFAGSQTGEVLNQGTIQTPDGGSVALLGARVSNEGSIVAPHGRVSLAAGQAVMLDVFGNALLHVVVQQGQANAQVSNSGLLQAPGGRVLLTTQTALDGLANAVNNTGLIQAQTLSNVNGSIQLLAGMSHGLVRVGGTLDASAPNGGDGGHVETSAQRVTVVDGAYIDTRAPLGKTGLWWLDPIDYTIAASLGDETPAQVTTSLASTNRTITATHDITLSDALTWTTARTLTLDAGHDVLIHGAVTASTAGSGLVLIAGNDVSVTSAITASGAGSVLTMNAGRNITSTAALTASESNTQISLTALGTISTGVITANAGGSISMKANQDVVINGAISADGGTVTLRADQDGSGPGVAAGTVQFVGVGAVSAPNTVIRFNPDGYANTSSEIASYASKVTGVLDARAWVFEQAANKSYDGLSDAALSFNGDPNTDSAGAVALVGSGASFGTPNAGVGKTVSYTGYSIQGANVNRFELFDAGTGSVLANITPALLSVTANNQSKGYGTTLSLDGSEFTAVGLQNTDAISSVSLASAGLAATAPVANSPYGVTPSAATGSSFAASNYTITYVNGALTITPALLSVTANNQSKGYGTTLSLDGSEFTAVGLQNTDAISSVSLASAGLAATAPVANSPYGVTPSAATGSSFAASNYTITYVNGVLTVTPALLSVTANNQSKGYGTTLSLDGSEFTAVGLQNTDAISSVSLASAGLAATAPVANSPYGVTPSAATGSSFAASNYTITYVNGALTITPALLSVTANNQSKGYGTTLSLDGSEFTAVGLQNTDAISSVSLASTGLAATAPVANSPYGVTPSAATGSSFAASNYTITYVNGVLTVTSITPPTIPVTPPAEPPLLPTPMPPVLELPELGVPLADSTGSEPKPTNDAQLVENLLFPLAPKQNAPLLITQAHMNPPFVSDPVLFTLEAIPVVKTVQPADMPQTVTAPIVALPVRPRRQDRN
ncbi:MBG domain-containing protein [Limnohabitans sp. JirII-29]|uniref:two-partner secretion domain-containing protein n=1 Tax=Limnohabitans sp. JirII-29 TaxID=1835756 RepID=UPI001304EE94|nr:MBG domain-containing protein [Limnohabitans sp. JirII-29]